MAQRVRVGPMKVQEVHLNMAHKIFRAHIFLEIVQG